MYVCMYVWMYVCMYVCLYIHIYIYICMYVCMYVCMYIYIYIYIYVLFIYLLISLSLSLCMYISLSLSLYIYIYICIHIYVSIDLSIYLPGFSRASAALGGRLRREAVQQTGQTQRPRRGAMEINKFQDASTCAETQRNDQVVLQQCNANIFFKRSLLLGHGFEKPSPPFAVSYLGVLLLYAMYVYVCMYVYICIDRHINTL